jgi:hypothetical protein
MATGVVRAVASNHEHDVARVTQLPGSRTV